ncbi:MAG: GNAT family N-acetyltransferase [Castellaniella sp.]|uniref:GNAT family N-acetyltransferase n=1 Tax=Castellaniella sp. TaxID=1955812 RepID=UPI00121E5447|nr:GNAT family N-acetyltransferase [Castellaniella sp.]TAN29579.1 MAG: GNAT family N-acetyltransferase [Castellaniella sp.]
MEIVTVRLSSVAELAAAPNLDELVQAYAAESALAQLGPAVLDVPAYARMEAAGIAHFLAAWRGARLVGFIILITSPVPHWGNQVIASTESFFVYPTERHGGVGQKLRKLAETVAHDVGARGIFISAPAGGRLERVLSRSGYQHSNTVFFQRLA